MPDTGRRRKRGREWKLSDAHEVGQLVLVRCGLCNVKLRTGTFVRPFLNPALLRSVSVFNRQDL
ncbi:MAG: hypothetical protein E5Y86_25615 [Mesorhizobium sp.]|nr:MAG: hypothetical protein E5Y86_25615 [Mesorhizobium sp.]